MGVKKIALNKKINGVLYEINFRSSADIILYGNTTVAERINYILNKIEPDESSYIYYGENAISQYPNIEIVDTYSIGDRIYVEPIEYNGNNLDFISVFGYTDSTNYVSLSGKLNIGDAEVIDIDRGYIKIRIVFNLTAVENCSYSCKFRKVDNTTISDTVAEHTTKLNELEARILALENSNQ